MKSVIARAITTTLFLYLAGNAYASVIVNNGPPNQSGASDLNAFLETDDFELFAPITTVSLVRFWTLQSSANDYAGAIDWSICQDSAGVPGTTCSSGLANATMVDTSVAALGLEEFRYEFAANVTLTSGVYWLTLHNGPRGAQPATEFYWEWSAEGGNSQSLDLSQPGQPWSGNSAELAFQLESATGGDINVPEPATVFLMGIGLAAMVKRRRSLVMRAA